MPSKLSSEDIHTGTVMEAVFEPNPLEKSSEFLYRATHLDGRRAPKVVLSKDPRIRSGVRCLVRVTRVEKKKREDRGYIEVELLQNLEFEISDVWLDPVVSRKLQVLLENGRNILLDGPQGCGKTVLARSIGTSMGYEFVFFNCSAVVEATDFIATLQVRSSESGAPVTSFLPTEILTALEAAQTDHRRRFLVFLDELNRCPESARNALMPALDTTRRIFNPITNQFIAIPDTVQFIAAVNRGDEFSGTFNIDAAQLDRFAPIAMDYLPAVEEVRMLSKRYPSVGDETIRVVVDIAQRIRNAAELGAGLSVRATDEVCAYLSHPVFAHDRAKMLPEILKDSFCGRYSGRWHDATTEAGAAWGIVQKALREGRP
ncbi:MAG TPA: MoxR family ATPase [Thermoanaerobaculia bacterium]|nr:MoxR family ATPase [Thermoanaerobaculia bacterium]